MPMAIQIERGRSIVGFARKAESGCGRLKGGFSDVDAAEEKLRSWIGVVTTEWVLQEACSSSTNV